MDFFSKIFAFIGINIKPVAGDIASPADGDLWYNGSLGKFRKKEAGVVSDMVTTGVGGVVATSAELNAGTDNTKFASALALEASEFLSRSDIKNYAITGGVADIYTLSPSPALTSYVAGQVFFIKWHVANTGATTINISGLGAKAVRKGVANALVSGDITIGTSIIIYDGIGFLLLTNPWLASGTGVPLNQTSPQIVTPFITTSINGGGSSFSLLTANSNITFASAVTTYVEGGTSTASLSATYFGNTTASGATKTLNFGTGAASGSTTAINLGSATSGATNNIKMNLLPATDASWDLFTRNASGYLERVPNGTTGQVLAATTSSKPAFATVSDNLKANVTSQVFVTPRLSSSSTTGYVWTAVDAIGNGTWQAASGGGGGGTSLKTFNRQPGSYTLVLADGLNNSVVVEMNSPSPANITIPSNAAVPFPIGTSIDIVQTDVPPVLVLVAGGVTIHSFNGWFRLNGQYAGATIVKVQPDEWYLFGNLNA